MKYSAIFIIILCASVGGSAQQRERDKSESPQARHYSLTDTQGLITNGLTVTPDVHHGKKGIQALLENESMNEPFIEVPGTDMTDGIIEVEVSGVPGKYAPDAAQGFVGIAFRIQNDSTYECIYIRPRAAVADDQIFRNRSVQYTSHPDYPWYRMREEFPGKYETYAPTRPDEWVTMRIEVEGPEARLFIDDAEEPNLIVNDLKLGGDARGTVGLWVGAGTLAHFRNLRVKDAAND